MFYLLFWFSDLLWACLRHAPQEKKALSFSRFATHQGAISLLTFNPAKLSKNLFTNIFWFSVAFSFLAHCKFAHTWPVEMKWITRLSEQKYPGGNNYCECDTQINEPIFKANGWVRSMMPQMKKGSPSLIRSFLFWKSDFTTYLNSNPLPVTLPTHNWSTVAGFYVILTSVSTKLRTTMRLTRNESPFRRSVMVALIITTFKHCRGSKERNHLFLPKLMA